MEPFSVEPFSDEEFQAFVDALSGVFDANEINGIPLWDWSNDGDMMRAWRFAPVPEDRQTRFSLYERELIFSICFLNDKYCFPYKPPCLYSLTFGHARLQFKSLESLIDAMTGIVKSLKLAQKYSGEVV